MIALASWIIDLLKQLPRELAVVLAASLPIIEVRGSVPLGIVFFKMGVIPTLLLSLLGGILPVFPILCLLKYGTDILRKINSFDRFFGWLFEHTKAKSGLIERFELLGLTIFMALPIPGAGIWTGCVAAYLLEIPWIPTFICAIIGTALATTVVWLATFGLVKLF